MVNFLPRVPPQVSLLMVPHPSSSFEKWYCDIRPLLSKKMKEPRQPLLMLGSLVLTLFLLSLPMVGHKLLGTQKCLPRRLRYSMGGSLPCKGIRSWSPIEVLMTQASGMGWSLNPSLIVILSRPKLSHSPRRRRGLIGLHTTHYHHIQVVLPSCNFSCSNFFLRCSNWSGG